jgi:hypothetical protein
MGSLIFGRAFSGLQHHRSPPPETILSQTDCGLFAADKHHADAIVQCFTGRHREDEGRTHEAWPKSRRGGGGGKPVHAYTTSHLRWSHKEFQVVTSRVTGNFGQPVDLRYRFRLERGLIAMLESP